MIGETLAERMASGRIPVDGAIAIALQIAEALESAHEKGIIHRDLKPGNMMVEQVLPEDIKAELRVAVKRFTEPSELGPTQSP